MRKIDELLDQYSSDHRNATNQLIHVVCVPAIVWSVTALLWTIPVPGTWFLPGAFSAFAMFLAWAYYWRLSRKLAMGLFVCFFASALLNRWIVDSYGMNTLLLLAVGVFVVAWIGQFIGHIVEGHRPSFFTDVVFLLIGPLWTLRKLYQRIGIGY
ncbi:MAG: Mpo1-like protein [Arenimonas sp.]|jgi:uncharacterized membrane protein YGL010W